MGCAKTPIFNNILICGKRSKLLKTKPDRPLEAIIVILPEILSRFSLANAQTKALIKRFLWEQNLVLTIGVERVVLRSRLVVQFYSDEL